MSDEGFEIVHADEGAPVAVAPPGGPAPAAGAAAAAGDARLSLPAELVRNLFFRDAEVGAHDRIALSQPAEYAAAVADMVGRGLWRDFTSATKANVLTVAFVRRLRAVKDLLLDASDTHVSIAEVLRAVTVLDANRLARQLRRKVAKLEASGARPGRLARLRVELNNAERDAIPGGSVTGATAKRFRAWIRTLPRDKLEFWLISFPHEPWRRLLDIVHARPDDFKLDSFSPVSFGAPAPEGSVIAVAQGVTRANVGETITKHPAVCDAYSFLRRRLADDPEVSRRLATERDSARLTALGFTRPQAYAALAAHRGNLQNAVEFMLTHPERTAPVPNNPLAVLDEGDRVLLAQHAPLEDLIWYYEELECEGVRDALLRRLRNGEGVDAVRDRSGFAKLMERLLLFRARRAPFADLLVPVAESRLADLVRSHRRAAGAHNPRVAVIGDASGSMEVAVQTSTVLSSLLSVAMGSTLTFFADSPWEAEVPSTVVGVLELVERTKAAGGTNMADALAPLLKERRAVDLVILVSDEGENSVGSDGRTFAEVFAEYRREVSPGCRIFLVSFLRENEEGLVRARLRDAGIEARQFRLSMERPDTSKFDSLLGHISLETSEAEIRYDAVLDALEGVGDLARLVTEF